MLKHSYAMACFALLTAACGGDDSKGGEGGQAGSAGSTSTGGASSGGNGGTGTGGGSTSGGAGGVSGGSGGVDAAVSDASTGGASGSAGDSGSGGSYSGGGSYGYDAGYTYDSGYSGSGGGTSLDSGAPEPDASMDASTVPDAGPGDATVAPDAPAVTCGGSSVVNVTAEGTPTASSTASGYSPGYAVDDLLTTGWFSSLNAATATFTWTGAADDCITRIQITNSSQVVPVWANWGFDSVTVKVETAAGDTVFSQAVDLAGEPDPNVDLATGGVVGRRVVLEFVGSTRSFDGFAELDVTALR